MEKSRLDVVEAARAYLGTPYRHQGRTQRGLDCIGLVLRVAHDLQITDYEVSHYGRVPSGRMMQRLIEEHCRKIAINQAVIGDMLHMAFEDQPQHVALLTDRGMIHADSRRGVVEHGIGDQWRMKIRAAYQLPGIS